MPTILVVDDEVMIRLAIADYLQECGFKVLEANSADEAVAILEKSAFHDRSGVQRRDDAGHA